MKKGYLVGFLILIFFQAGAQDFLNQSIRLSIKNLTLSEALQVIGETSEATFSFNPELLPADRRVSLHSDNITLKAALEAIFENTRLGFEQVGNQIVLFDKLARLARQKFTLFGYVEDAQTGERLIGAHIFDAFSGTGTYSNSYGFFSLTLPGGEVALAISFLGYQTFMRKFILEKSQLSTVFLQPSFTLGEVVISARKPSARENLANQNISALDLNSMQAIGGESDLFMSVLTFAGVQSGAQGVGGLHVRGGSSDQNLVLLDDVPVYNPTHTWGIYSIFNTSAIQGVQFLKSGFPARYGGRLSSVMDVRTKDGNKKELQGEIETGILSGKITLEGPIVQDKASFFISGRRAFTDLYSNYYFRRQRNKEPGTSGTIDYFFYDLNLKVNYTPSIRDKIYFSFYRGEDIYRDNLEIQAFAPYTVAYFDENFQQNWGNNIGAFRWNHTFNNKLFANATLTFSRFEYQSRDFKNLEAYERGNKFLDVFSISKYNSNIEDRTGKVDFEYFPSPNHTFRFGVKATDYRFQPGVVEVAEDLQSNQTNRDSITVSLDTFWRRSSLRAFETAGYLEDQFKLWERAEFRMGVYSAAFRSGSQTWFSFEPRFHFSWKWNERFKSGLSYERMTQFLHLLSASSIGLPNDIWVSATESTEPQRAFQWTAWADFKFDARHEAAISVYYKELNNLIEFQEANTFLLNASNWENSIVPGWGWSYGLEFSLRKNAGSWHGWANYTYAFANRQFEELNNNRIFPFRFDRRHVFNLVLFKDFKKNFQVYTSWTYSTGLATSLPVGRYAAIPGIALPPLEVLTFDSRNGFRMPDYHFLDVGFQYSWVNSWGPQMFKFGVHNIYFRKNPIYYELREENQYYQRFVPPLLPSLSYILKI